MPNLLNQWTAAEYNRLFTETDAFVLVSYTGIDSEETATLRDSLRDGNMEMTVIRNRIAKKVLASLGHDGFGDQFAGQTAVIVGKGELGEEAPKLGKAVVDLCKTLPQKLVIKGGLAEGEILDQAGVVALSKQPTRDELVAQLLGLFQAPVTQALAIMQAPVTNMLGLLMAAEADKNQS